MLENIREMIRSGIPTIAECGGFMYLTEAIGEHPMVGFLPGRCFDAGKLARFGYVTLTAERDNLLCRAGGSIPAHEFHHWDSSENGTDFSVCKTEKRQWECGFANAHLYAGFPHLYWAGTALPRRFVQAAQHFLKHKG